MIDTLIICITVLLLAAGLYHFANRFLTTAKAWEAAIAARLAADVDRRVALIETRVGDAHAKVEEYRIELKRDIEGLFANQKNISNSLAMNSKSPNSIASVLENLKAGGGIRK